MTSCAASTTCLLIRMMRENALCFQSSSTSATSLMTEATVSVKGMAAPRAQPHQPPRQEPHRPPRHASHSRLPEHPRRRSLRAARRGAEEAHRRSARRARSALRTRMMMGGWLHPAKLAAWPLRPLMASARANKASTWCCSPSHEICEAPHAAGRRGTVVFTF